MTTRYMVRYSNESSKQLLSCSNLRDAKSFAATMQREGYQTLIIKITVEAV